MRHLLCTQSPGENQSRAQAWSGASPRASRPRAGGLRGCVRLCVCRGGGLPSPPSSHLPEGRRRRGHSGAIGIVPGLSDRSSLSHRYLPTTQSPGPSHTHRAATLEGCFLHSGSHGEDFPMMSHLT